MTQIIIGYANAATGINEIREANAKEAKELLESQANAAMIRNAESEKKLMQEAAKAAAEAKLSALGLTADDLKALGLKAEQSTPSVTNEAKAK